MNNFKLKFRGETLVEVLVAIGILGVVLITSFVLVNRGVGTNVTVKNKILAINIAREGIEGMRNIRDTNWLKYSGDRRNKWLWDEGIGELITNGYYVIDFTSNKFVLKKDPNIQYKLDLSVPSNDYEKYRLFKVAGDSHYKSTIGGGGNETIFYRQLILEAETPPECDDSPASEPDCSAGSRLHVISRVQWREPLLAGNEAASQSDLIGTIVMETYLYDYLGRDEY